MILALTEAELKEVLAARPYERTGERQGYRHGKMSRWITTDLGAALVALPRARLLEDGQEREWHSGLIRRYERRSRSVDCALLGTYLAGANGRRIRGALSPLLRGAPLSKSAISRIVGRLQSLFCSWRKRSLEGFSPGGALPGCNRAQGQSGQQGGVGADVGGLGGWPGWAEGGVGAGAAHKRIDFPLEWIGARVGRSRSEAATPGGH